jgi:hypothetical protein
MACGGRAMPIRFLFGLPVMSEFVWQIATRGPEAGADLFRGIADIASRLLAASVWYSADMRL